MVNTTINQTAAATSVDPESLATTNNVEVMLTQGSPLARTSSSLPKTAVHSKECAGPIISVEWLDLPHGIRRRALQEQARKRHSDAETVAMAITLAKQGGGARNPDGNMHQHKRQPEKRKSPPAPASGAKKPKTAPSADRRRPPLYSQVVTATNVAFISLDPAKPHLNMEDADLIRDG